MALIALQGEFECGSFRLIVAGETARLREIEPQRHCRGIGIRGRAEMKQSGVVVVPREGLHAEHVVRDGVIALQPQRRLRLADHVGAPSLLLRLNGAGKMLFGGHRHGLK